MMFRPYSIIHAPVAPITEDEDLSGQRTSNLEINKDTAEMVRDLLSVKGRLVINNTNITKAINKLQGIYAILSLNRILYQKQLDDIEHAINFMAALTES